MKPAAVLIFGGTPSSVKSLRPWKEIAAADNIPVHLLERPGFGDSPPSPRSFAGWRRQVADFLSARQIDSFALIGISGGGPHALSCADHPACQKVILVSSAGRHETVMTARLLSDAMRNLFLLARNNDVKALSALIAAQQGDFDPSVYNFGFRPTAEELVLITRDWDFDLKSITCEVCAFHAEDDVVAPVEIIDDLSRCIKNFRQIRVRGGHGFFRENGWREKILREANSP